MTYQPAGLILFHSRTGHTDRAVGVFAATTVVPNDLDGTADMFSRPRTLADAQRFAPATGGPA